MKRLFIFLSAFVCFGASTQNGVIVDPAVRSDRPTQKTYFCAPTAQGSGDCLSWDNACLFRTAVSKLSSSYTTTIFLSAGVHDTNNGSDATGTTISTNYVRIFGLNGVQESPMSRLVNSHAGATHVLIFTGDYLSVNGISFGNSDQADKNVIMLNLQGNYNEVFNCSFSNAAGDGGGTGILVDNGAVGTFITKCHFFSVIDYGINFGATTDAVIQNLDFYYGGTGIYVSSGSADRLVFQDMEILQLTTGLDYSIAPTKSFYFNRLYFAHNTANVAALTDYGSSWFQNIVSSRRTSATYPTAAGVSCNTGDGTWVWTVAATTIIPGDTINKPFLLTGINLQDWNASQTYKLELLYGDGAATTSLGIFEITVGDPSTNRGKANTSLPINIYLPAYTLVGVKVMSSTDGVDNVTLTLGYELL